MTLNQLRYFQAVCLYGSVIQAAQELHISQPSVSVAIKELETDFGVELFHRLNKRLILTHEGEIFRENVDILLERSNALEELMRNFGGKYNPIKIGVPPMIGAFLFPAMFNEFHQLHPEIRLEIQEYGSLQSRQLVENDFVDMAIVIIDDQLIQEVNIVHILDTRLIYCVSHDHHLANREVVSLDDLKSEPLVLMKPDSFQNKIIRQRFMEMGVEPNVLLSSSQLYTIQKFAVKGAAGAFLFEEVAHLDPNLVGIPLDQPISIPIGLIWKKDRHMNSVALKFIEFTRKYNIG